VQNFLSADRRGDDHTEDLDIDERMMLGCMSEKWVDSSGQNREQ